MGNTTLLHRKLNGAWGLANTVYRKMGGAWGAANAVYLKQSGVWGMVYSTPTVSVSNTGSVTGSGASSAGTTSGSVAATPGGTNSGSLSYAYAYVSGDSGFSITSGDGTTTPTFSHSFSSVSNGTTSSGVSAVWQCTITDTVTGATSMGNFTVGPFAWENTIPAESPLSVSAPDVSHEDDVFGAQSDRVSGSTTATATGGSGSYSYAWTYVSGDAGISVDNLSLQSPTFTSELMSVGGVGDSQTASGVWRCTVTDTESHTAHCDINITLTLFEIND